MNLSRRQRWRAYTKNMELDTAAVCDWAVRAVQRKKGYQLGKQVAELMNFGFACAGRRPCACAGINYGGGGLYWRVTL